MSAITGIFYRDGRSVDPELMKKMNKRLAHRGPDGSSTWCEGPVALGHQMLFTTHESLHEKLPFEDEESGLVITADARIDNRKELSELLELEDIEKVSDSLFILKAYEKWGESCPEKLLGDFAFAIWDKNNEKLFCARDHMGVKPFYYYLSDEAFFFATEMKALFTIPEVPYKVNELKMASFVLINTQDKLLTFYEDVLCLVPAHSLNLNSNESQIRQYWELDPESEILMDSDEDYINAFREIFAEAINCRLRSAFPVGFELSGGLDSSSVVCTARKILNEGKKSPSNSINTFSYVFDDFPEVDERYYIEKVLNAGGIEPNFVFADKISPLDQIETILWHQEQPFYTPNMAIMWDSYKKMEEKGIRILLGGNGGDEIISHGENYLKELAITFQWKKLMNELKAMSKHSNTSYYHLMAAYFIFPFIPEIFKNLISRKEDMFKKNGTLILNKDFVKRLGGEKYLRDLKWKPVEEVNTAKKNHYLLITSNQYVLEMLDRGTAAFSIETRYPYYDKRLIEFCYAIPDEMKFKFGWDRFIQRIAMEDILPPEIQWRHGKSNFSPFYEKNLLLFEKNSLDKIACPDNEIIKDYIDLDILTDLYEKYNCGNNKSIGNDVFGVWLSTLLYLWLTEIDYSKV